MLWLARALEETGDTAGTPTGAQMRESGRSVARRHHRRLCRWRTDYGATNVPFLLAQLVITVAAVWPAS